MALMPNFRDGLLIRLPSSPILRPQKLYWFVRNGHHSLTTSSLYCRKALHPPFFIAIPFPPVSGRSLIQAQLAKLSLTLSSSNLLSNLLKDVNGLPNLPLPCVVTVCGSSFCCLHIDLVSSLCDVFR
ncbi:unnamed protein product [Protopolystoma xenopodis]|uniref:Uncharacterized protein n=1 Tax=Protopolystoma xenopodis TaxID=117903 RepID=A0A448X4N5_9PLAT|nr:unnamed protein product [Protopolystoma xenopodis]